MIQIYTDFSHIYIAELYVNLKSINEHHYERYG